MIVTNNIKGAIHPEDIALMYNAVSIGDVISVKTKIGDKKGKVIYKTPYFAVVKTKGGLIDSRLWVDMIITERSKIKQ